MTRYSAPLRGSVRVAWGPVQYRKISLKVLHALRVYLKKKDISLPQGRYSASVDV